MSVRSEEFRHALAHWATGVAVLTCRWQSAPYALTVTSFSSVSLDPPLVLVCIGKQSRFHTPVTAAGTWAVSVLAGDQGALARRFSAHGRAYATQFDDVATTPAPSGTPVLDGSLVWLDCRTVAEHDAGDHTIVVGEVVHTGPLSQTGAPVAESPRRHPLTYYRGAFSDVTAH
ncbi:flavin reductase family protein [Microlunatus aurantiacus]|uniref:Flavin reductase family protein n=1 Tax=Microlunatus aurantiacus TaxID=446786 RepID=A0ABP7DUT2_9ACTN